MYTIEDFTKEKNKTNREKFKKISKLSLLFISVFLRDDLRLISNI